MYKHNTQTNDQNERPNRRRARHGCDCIHTDSTLALVEPRGHISLTGAKPTFLCLPNNASQYEFCCVFSRNLPLSSFETDSQKRASLTVVLHSGGWESSVSSGSLLDWTGGGYYEPRFRLPDSGPGAKFTETAKRAFLGSDFFCTLGLMDSSDESKLPGGKRAKEELANAFPSAIRQDALVAPERRCKA
jgi:hypothetical protein